MNNIIKTKHTSRPTDISMTTKIQYISRYEKNIKTDKK